MFPPYSTLLFTRVSRLCDVAEQRTETKILYALMQRECRSIAQAVIPLAFPLRRPGFEPGSSQVGFVVDKVALGQIFFSEYLGFPCQSLFHQFLHNHHHLSSGAGTIGQ
jgi:hypothetical protein